MAEYEYEVLFIVGGVNIRTIVYLDDENIGEGENFIWKTVEDKAQDYAARKVYEDTGLDFDVDVCDEVSVMHTATIGGY